MSTLDDAAPSPLGLSRRLDRLEWIVPNISGELTTTVTKLNQVADEQTTMRQIQKDTAEDVGQLKKSLDRLTWAIVTMAFTIAASAVGLAITIASHAA